MQVCGSAVPQASEAAEVVVAAAAAAAASASASASSVAVVLVCGVPASGKSTLTNVLARVLEREYELRTHVLVVDDLERHRGARAGERGTDDAAGGAADEADSGDRRSDDVREQHRAVDGAVYAATATAHGPAMPSAAQWTPESWKEARTSAVEHVRGKLRSAQGTSAASDAATTASPGGAAACERSQPLVLLVEDVFHLHSMRKRFADMCWKERAQFAEIFCVADTSDVQARNAGRAEPVPEHVIDRAVALFELPDAGASGLPPSSSPLVPRLRGALADDSPPLTASSSLSSFSLSSAPPSWERHHLVLDTSASSCDECVAAAVAFVQQVMSSAPWWRAREQSEKLREASRVANQGNVRHLAELELRKRIAAWMRSCPAAERSSRAAATVAMKRSCMERVLDSVEAYVSDFEERIASFEAAASAASASLGVAPGHASS